TDLNDNTDTDRSNPEYKTILVDINHPLPNTPPNVLEGFVEPVPANENQDSQAPAEVSEEEVPWNHYTHDYTFKIIPDAQYQNLLSSWTRFPGLTITVDGTDAEAAAACGILGGSYLGGNQCQLAAAESCPEGQAGDTCHHTDMEVEWENA